MKHICIMFLVCLMAAACKSEATSTPAPDNNATVVAGVMQTLTAQAAPNNQDVINTAIAQTLTAMPPSLPSPTTPPVVDQIPASTNSPGGSEPLIIFTSVPPMGSNEYLYGRVEGVDPAKYVVAVYIRVSGGWWTKPYFADPTTPIASDGTWSCPYATGGNDTSATALRAYLIPIGFNPPAMQGGTNLPAELTQNAEAMVEATR